MAQAQAGEVIPVTQVDEMSRMLGRIETGLDHVKEVQQGHTEQLGEVIRLQRETNGRVNDLEGDRESHAKLLAAHEEQLEAIRMAKHDREVMLDFGRRALLFVRSWKGKALTGFAGVSTLLAAVALVRATLEQWFGLFTGWTR